jgi:hypothetical protein
MANAVDHEQKEQAAAAREKSAVLEEKASAEGSKTQPTLEPEVDIHGNFAYSRCHPKITNEPKW